MNHYIVYNIISDEFSITEHQYSSKKDAEVAFEKYEKYGYRIGGLESEWEDDFIYYYQLHLKHLANYQKDVHI